MDRGDPAVYRESSSSVKNRVGSHRAARAGDASRRSSIALVGAGTRAPAHPESAPADAADELIACPSCDQPAPYVSASGESGKTVQCPVCGPGRVIDIDNWDDDTAFLPAALPLPDEVPAEAAPRERGPVIPLVSPPTMLAAGGVAAVVLGIVLVRALSGPASVAQPVASAPASVEVAAAPSAPDPAASVPEVASSIAGVIVAPAPAAPPLGELDGGAPAPEVVPASEPASDATSAATEAKPAPAAESKATMLYAPIAEPAKVVEEPAKKVEPVEKVVEKAVGKKPPVAEARPLAEAKPEKPVAPVVEAKIAVAPVPPPVVAAPAAPAATSAAPVPAAPAAAAPPVAEKPAPVAVAALAPPPAVAPPAPAAANATAPALGDTDLPSGAIGPKPLEGNPAPRYPKLAHRSGKGGDVVLRILITAEGLVGEVHVLQGKEPFVGAAVKAVKKWRYEPAQHHGQAIPVHRTIRLGFAMSS